jgi:hypothetical protein
MEPFTNSAILPAIIVAAYLAPWDLFFSHLSAFKNQKVLLVDFYCPSRPYSKALLDQDHIRVGIM